MKPKTVVVSTRLDENTYERLQALAERLGVKKTTLACDAIKIAVDRIEQIEKLNEKKENHGQSNI